MRTLPEGLSWKAAVCLDPADFALGAVRAGHVRIAVAVFGMGATGLVKLTATLPASAAPSRCTRAFYHRVAGD
ncbi:MAG: hypothetical protein OXM87_02130 [Truepera sp.]|nr:hypothetical protein [Truepera sp.]